MSFRRVTGGQATCDLEGCQVTQQVIVEDHSNKPGQATLLRAMGWWVSEPDAQGSITTYCPSHLVVGRGQVVTVRLCLSDPGAVIARDLNAGPGRDEVEPLFVWQERALHFAKLIKEGA